MAAARARLFLLWPFALCSLLAPGILAAPPPEELRRAFADNLQLFQPYVKAEVGSTESVFVLWATAWVAKRRGTLNDYAPLFTPEVLRKAAANLKQDQVRYNASRAVRLFLLLGDQSIPTLREVCGAGDPQAAMLAKATIDALGGKRKAFGYLVAKLDITQVLSGPEIKEPDWISDAAEPYVYNDRPY